MALCGKGVLCSSCVYLFKICAETTKEDNSMLAKHKKIINNKELPHKRTDHVTVVMAVLCCLVATFLLLLLLLVFVEGEEEEERGDEEDMSCDS